MGWSKRAHRIPLIDGDEEDAFTDWRDLVFWQKGELRRIKRKYAKRQRKQVKQKLRQGDWDVL